MLILPRITGRAFPHPSSRVSPVPSQPPCFICRLKPSDPALAASPADFRPSPFQIFAPSTSCPSFIGIYGCSTRRARKHALRRRRRQYDGRSAQTPPNVELVAQGIANITVAAFFWRDSLPREPSLRTATPTSAPARVQPVSGIVHALTLLAVLLAAAPLASYIPLATLAAVLFVVAYNMGEWRNPGILQLLTAISAWLVTFALTVFAELTVAVSVGTWH